MSLLKYIPNIFIYLLCVLYANATSTNTQNPLNYHTSGDNCSFNYRQVIRQILEDDELFVLFYLDAALIVDPNEESPIVIPISTYKPWVSIKENLFDKRVY